jgi:uncharacterized membrane protein
MQLGRFMGYLHPALIHFPIVLLITAVVLEAVGFFRRDVRMAWVARLILVLGTVTTLFAFVCGNFAELWAARAGISQEALEYHEFLATITSWLFVALTAWRILMTDSTPRPWRAAWLVSGIGACILLGLTGHHGASLVYEYGAAVQNIGLLRVPSHEDLFTLTQRQDAESIFYSDMMHHIFGWMVLLISALLLLDQVSPKVGEKARRFGPLLLFAGGLFLLIFSDQDAWPLYNVRPFRPITDKEVLLHKTYAVLMLIIGARGLWQILRKKGEAAVAGLKVQDRLMAVFALVGGALLFTHIHSAAPYANIAVGVYIHHTVMGFVALCIGAVKLLDDAAGQPARWRRLAYPALMCAEAVLLINYNEGLPWFMGYRGYSTIAARGGLVAPLGPHRAELVYHPDTTRMELFVQEKDGLAPVALPVRYVTAVVRQGDDSTEVTLPCNPGGEPASAHFASNVSFLRGLPLFQVQAHVTVGGKQYSADFEPWVDKSQAVTTGAHYACPMHPHVTAQTADTCSVCNMRLEKPRPPRPTGQLHDPEFTAQIQVTPTQPQPDAPTRLQLTVQRRQAVIPLDVVHTKKMHLIVVSRDLSFFDHVHPVEQPDGSYVIDYTFPNSGEYVLYADVTPAGAYNQVFRMPVTVGGPPAPPARLVETPASARLIGDYRVALTASPYPLRAQDEANLTFTLSESGKPVTDLQAYLGAGGHCVILSGDTADYLHSHPLEPPGSSITGPQVQFHTRFPRSGLYKVWGQFLHAGRVMTADFVLRVN